MKAKIKTLVLVYLAIFGALAIVWWLMGVFD